MEIQKEDCCAVFITRIGKSIEGERWTSIYLYPESIIRRRQRDAADGQG